MNEIDWDKILKPTKLRWWIRFLLFFKHPICSADWGTDILYVVCLKSLFGITYIVDCEAKKMDG